MKLKSTLGLLSLLFLASSGQAQSLRWMKAGSYSTQAYGRSVSSLADVNGDGYRDILIGDPLAEPLGSLNGEVHLVSGQDGSPIYTITGATTSSRIGEDVLGIQDVDGDGTEDFVITSDTEFPQVRSGIDGSFIRSLSIFSSAGDQVVESLGDIDGDGLRELIVGHQDFGTNHGRVLVLRGSYVATGIGPSLLWTRDGIQSFGFFGDEVANAGDVNGDGFDDVVAGGPAETGPSGECGIVYMLNGINGNVIHSLTVSTSCIGFGSELDSAGDWNQDGRADIVVGTRSDNTGGSSAGAMRIYSGLTGGLLLEVFGAASDRYGRAVLGGIDIDGDGHDEVLVGAYTKPCATGRGTVHAFDPITNAIQADVCGASDANLFGGGLQAVGDVNGDGQQDFVVTDSEAEPSLEARVYLFDGDCAGYVASFCDSTTHSGGSRATITGSGSTSIATNSMALIARSCPANKPGLFFYGRNQIMAPFGDGFRCAGGMSYRLYPIVQTDGMGIVARALDLTVFPLGSGSGQAVPGSIYNFQFWFRDPTGPGGTGFNLTDGVSIRFCP